MVVVEREHVAQLVDPGFVRRAQLDRAVGLLPRASRSAARERRHEDAVDHRAGRVAACPGGVAKGVRVVSRAMVPNTASIKRKKFPPVNKP